MAEAGLSIVIPVLNEASGLDQQLVDLKSKLNAGTPHEIIVSDGGSNDETLAIAEAHHCVIVEGPAGRSAQLNAGAEAARYSLLIFLHADTVLAQFL